MEVFTGDFGSQYRLADKPFSSGGEGALFDITNKPGYVAKLYHKDKITQELEQKILYMLEREHKPEDYIREQVAWPHDILTDKAHHFCGFIMKKLSITNELGDLYKYPLPNNSGITTEHKIIVAINIATVIAEVHRLGYVFGDFNPRNIGVDMKTGHVAFLDTDSYHIVIDKTKNHAFRCKVGFDGYIAPELLAKIDNEKKINPAHANYEKAPLDTFTTYTDRFALAIHIFKLLMNGYTPFNGVSETSTLSTAFPGVGNEAIKRNSYCFKLGNKPLSPAIPPLKSLPAYISKLFAHAFVDGRTKPEQRPSAKEWCNALNTYHNELKHCKTDLRHYYHNSQNTCPLCEADKNYKAGLTSARPLQQAQYIQQKTFTSPTVVMPPTFLHTNPTTKTAAKVTKKCLKFYGVTLFLSSFLSWCLAVFVVPTLFSSRNLIAFIVNLSPYIVFLAGIGGCLFYNINHAFKCDLKDHLVSVCVSGISSAVIGVALYILVRFFPILIVALIIYLLFIRKKSD